MILFYDLDENKDDDVLMMRCAKILFFSFGHLADLYAAWSKFYCLGQFIIVKPFFAFFFIFFYFLLFSFDSFIFLLLVSL